MVPSTTPYAVPKFTSAEQVAFENTLPPNHPAYVFEQTDGGDAGKIFISRNGLNVAFSVNAVSNSTATLIHNVVGGGTATGVVVGSMGVSNDPNITSDSYANVVQCTGNAVWNNDASLTTISAPTLNEIDGALSITNCINFTTLDFPELSALAGTTTISGCTALVNLTLGSSDLVATGAITVSNNGGLLNLTLNHGTLPNFTAGTNVALQTLSFPNTTAAGLVSVTGSTNFAAFNAPVLQSVGGLTIANYSGTTLSYPNLTTVVSGSISFPSAPNLNTVDFSGVTAVPGAVTLVGSASVVAGGACDFSSLVSAQSVNITSTGCTSIDMSSLTSVTNSLVLEKAQQSAGYGLNTSLNSVDFSALQSVGDLCIAQTPGTPTPGIPDTGTVNLVTANFPALIEIKGPLVVAGNSGGSGTPDDFRARNAALTTLGLPLVSEITGGVHMGAVVNSARINCLNPALTTFSLPSLLKLGSNFFCCNAALSVASVRAIIQRLAAMDGTAGTTPWNNKTLNLSGGTSAGKAAAVDADPPTLAAYNILIGAGRTNTVTMNP